LKRRGEARAVGTEREKEEVWKLGFNIRGKENAKCGSPRWREIRGKKYVRTD